MKTTPDPCSQIQELGMYQVHMTLKKGMAHPFIGVLPACLTVLVSAAEVVSALAYAILIYEVGHKVYSQTRTVHEMNACISHVALGAVAGYYSIFGIITLGLGPYIDRECGIIRP